MRTSRRSRIQRAGLTTKGAAGDIERLERLLNEAAEEQWESRLGIDLVDLAEKKETPATGQVTYLVDMAKADVLELLGDNEKALDLVDRYVSPLPNCFFALGAPTRARMDEHMVHWLGSLKV